MASSSSSSVQQKFQVFLSFRGEDTRTNFTSHLHAALKRKGIDTFVDNRLERGEEISITLLTAIEESTISIIVLSKNFASSSWCLDELSKILECKERRGQKVIPIFYHVDPSDVRKQKGSFKEAFAKQQKRFKDRKDKVKKWRADFVEVSGLAGHHLSGQPNDRLESEVVEEIAQDISKKLMCKSFVDTKPLVGIDSRVKEIEWLLCMDSIDVRIVGIWGMGGIGKTTIAEVVYKRFVAKFDGCCFVNVRKELNYRQKLFSEILGDKNLNVDTNLLDASISDRLQRKKVFIVLDDVNDLEQLDLLVLRFGPGSRIIVTSRDKKLFETEGIHVTYEVRGLIDDEALRLFSLCAFKQNHPKEDFVELSKEVVRYVKGLPLALRVFGSSLYGKTTFEWTRDLKKLKEIPNPKIDNILRNSYDGLDGELKDIFLDIACFFNWKHHDHIIDLLNGSYYSAMSGIRDLIDRSLLSISCNMIKMHDLLRQMALNIICQEPNKPGKRRRLCTPKDICPVLENDTGTESVEGILLDMSKISGKVCISPTAFTRMYNLKFLKFYYSGLKGERKVLLEKGLESLPGILSYLYWDEYPSKSLPSNFCPENLVELSMIGSNVIQLWDGVQNLVKLKRLDLSYSPYLIKIPDLSQAINLEEITVRFCTNLKEVPPSIRCLNKLSSLNLFGCKQLENVYLFDSSIVTKFPELPENLEFLSLCGTAIEDVHSIRLLPRLTRLGLINCKRLERLPSSICKLKFLRELDLSGCLQLESFPEISETMECLAYLTLSHTSIEELPSSIENLVGLIELELNFCEKLKNLPSSIRQLKSLQVLSLINCSNVTKFPEIPGNLNWLNLSGTSIEQLLFSIYCLSKHTDSYLSSLSILFPGSAIPEWFGCKSQGSLLLPHLHDEKFLGFAVCAVFGFSKPLNDNHLEDFRVGCRYLKTNHHFKDFRLSCPYNFDTNQSSSSLPLQDESKGSRFIDGDHVFLSYNTKFYGCRYAEESDSEHHLVEVSFIPNVRYTDRVDLFDYCVFKESGVFLLYGQEIRLFANSCQDFGDPLVATLSRPRDDN